MDSWPHPAELFLWSKSNLGALFHLSLSLDFGCILKYSPNLCQETKTFSSIETMIGVSWSLDCNVTITVGESPIQPKSKLLFSHRKCAVFHSAANTVASSCDLPGRQKIIHLYWASEVSGLQSTWQIATLIHPIRWSWVALIQKIHICWIKDFYYSARKRI